MARTDRGPVLTVFALLFGLLAISNFMKPLAGKPGEVGFVFFGQRLAGTPNAIIGPLFGLYLLVYAIGIWRMRRYAVPMGIAYAAYVILNLVLFNVRDPNPNRQGLLFGLLYGVIAIGVSSGAAYLLAQRRAELT
jgi:hypothetical protein